MDCLHVSLFGQFSVKDARQTLIPFHSHKEEELFAFLVMRRARPNSREALASLLWGDTTTAQSKKYLRTALWRLRADLGCPAGDERLLRAGKQWVQLCPEAAVWSDVGVLEAAAKALRAPTEAPLDATAADRLGAALDHYRGELLEGWYHEWCLFERERFQQIYFRLTDALMHFCETHHDYDRGIACGLRMLAREPARERTHRQMMRLYQLAGDRYSALRQYQRCAETLQEELGVAPAVRTEQLYQQIRADAVPPARLPAAAPRAATLQALLGTIGQLQTALNEVRLQLATELARHDRSTSEADPSF